MKLHRSLLVYIVILMAGCTVTPQNGSMPTTSSVMITATLPSTSTPRPSETPLSPPSQPTVVPVEGITSTQLNVRAEPSTISDVLGILAANSTVQIVGRDAAENWWQIVYEAGSDGKGWVTAQYVKTGDSSQVPVMGGGPSNPQAGNTANVVQQLNIRSGPGTGFNSIGILNVNDVVRLTGRNSKGDWLQIDFPSGPDGRGWVSSGFIKADDTASLPILSDAGDVVGNGTPADTPPPPTPTVVPAAMDFDSADAPIKTVILGGASASTVLYNGDVSAPQGDTEDWVSVSSQGVDVFAAIKCLGSQAVKVEVFGSGATLICNRVLQKLPASGNEPFLIHVQAFGNGNQLQYTKYELTIKVSP